MKKKLFFAAYLIIMIEREETHLHSAIWLCCVALTLGEWPSLYWLLAAHCAMLAVQDPVMVVAENSQEKPKPPEDTEALEQAQIKGPVEVPGGEAPKEKQEAAQLDRPGQGKRLGGTGCLTEKGSCSAVQEGLAWLPQPRPVLCLALSQGNCPLPFLSQH